MKFDNAVTDIRFREGFEKGFEKGFGDGFEKGFKKHAKLVVKNLLKQGNLTPETIATVTAIPLETVDKMSENIKRKKKKK